MVLHDHFHPPLSVDRPWEGFHSAWAAMIAQELNGLLPPQYVALPQVSRGPAVEIDVAALELAVVAGDRSSVADWQPDAPAWSGTVDWSRRDLFEIRIIDQTASPRLAGAIELVSPANKDRPAARQAFAGKCAGYLRQGVGVLIVDVVTTRQQDLHRGLLELLELDPPTPTIAGTGLYAVAYRTHTDEPARLDIWPRELSVGAELPTLPLWLNPILAVPVHLQSSYSAACRMLRIA